MELVRLLIIVYDINFAIDPRPFFAFFYDLLKNSVRLTLGKDAG